MKIAQKSAHKTEFQYNQEMKQYCYLDGKIRPLDEAKISVSDIGLLRGYGVYDGLAVMGGKVFRLADHWRRFTRGAEALNIKIPITEVALEKKIINLTEKSGLKDRANIRLILTGGETLEGIEYDFNKPTFFITAGQWKSLPNEYYEKGIKLMTYDYQREMPEIKTINYITAVRLQTLKKKEEATEILYVHKGMVLEGATSNIILVKDNTLITPVANVLEGVTRKVVEELISGDYKVEKRDIKEAELKSADEAFITSSFRDIVPVTKIDNFTVGNGQVGTITKEVMNRFAKYCM
ncbi:MAG: hypothetical protein CO183_01040 [Candidatus Zambryskibacteria bacterium CG_4_9_14_3_um_filter_42_9]|uniref:Branched-chain amino acid aminotransferase n=1 Tax=Candidatus Zambryskibacteria bacterium CG22_combo_CG10-13_8_21_14_all_42_17 TaxID=1975118 RepID=A0A2H0BD93_9BACT|nr:MAG: hypothetical protein COX06_02225 [Candidatus Zambryskibacteria bacterium CG22_combo_CG10-13_8_21_14_all_42_17]PJA36919.1 MAG: hypothetical protein CO183_01040 [Candidatus Zambryskibacteria bacterium CG_4_9_14_3_um_filter_42_9]